MTAKYFARAAEHPCGWRFSGGIVRGISAPIQIQDFMCKVLNIPKGKLRLITHALLFRR